MPARRSRGVAQIRVVVSDRLGRPVRDQGVGRWLAGVAPAGARGSVTVALVSDSEIRRLNRRFAQVDRVTDVLAFGREAAGDPGPARLGGVVHLGDIAIATGVARRQARGDGHALRTELRILALHGLLHLLGYDHTQDKGQMARAERRLRRRGGLVEGLIQRVAGSTADTAQP
jgi:probable rRNA maturation factor